MLTTYPDIYAAQRHHVQAVEPPSWDIMSPPFTVTYAGTKRVRKVRLGFCETEADSSWTAEAWNAVKVNSVRRTGWQRA